MSDWYSARVCDVCEQISVGTKYSKELVQDHGNIKVLDQSQVDIFGWHNNSADIYASPESPVFTFANHTCSMRWMDEPFSVIQNVFPMRGILGKTDTRFLYYASGASVVQDGYKGHFPQFRESIIQIPPLPEQKKIAEILSGIDRLVEAKKRRVKQRKLLLKSAFEDATKKEASDNFVSLSGLGRWRGGGTPSKSIPEYWGGVIPWVSPKDMKGRKISCSQDAITQEAIENSTASLIPKDSILFVVRSGILRHTFPIALATREVAINQDLKALTVSDHCIPNFLFHYLCCRSEEMLASCMKSGTTVESIDTNSLQNYQVPVISIQEQLRLSLFAESITMAIEAEESQVESLKMLKSSLGSDLLSGRKRVSV